MRQLINTRAFLTVPLAFSPLSAKLVERLGFESIYVGGYGIGAELGTGEPLLTASEMVDSTRRIVEAVAVPVIADAGAGFGTAIHTRRTVLEFEAAGTAAIHIEDQVVPKRIGYHRGIVEIIPREEMVRKLEVALEARTDPDFMIIARTDARHAVNGGVQEMRSRLELYADIGADALLAFPATMEEAQALVGWVGKPVIYPIAEGRTTRPDLDVTTLEAMGYKMAILSEGPLFAAYSGLKEYYGLLGQASRGIEVDKVRALREDLEDVIGLKFAYSIEVKK